MIDAKRMGERMQRACERRGISVRELQEELNVGAFQSIYNWFNGKALPTLENYFGFCRLLQIPMESLIVLKGASATGMECVSARYDFCRKFVNAEAEMQVWTEHFPLMSLSEESKSRLREYVAAVNVFPK